MAIRQYGTLPLERLEGLSADAKPGYDDDIATGTQFLETDTQRRFTWDGTSWVELIDRAGQTREALSDKLDLLLFEQRKTNELLLMILARFS